MSNGHDSGETPPGSPGMGQSPEVIRITHADARDPHVDAVLERQKSMRGEPGMVHPRTSKWYHRAWFVLGLAGALAALATWAAIEPAVEDMLYFQGPIAEIEARPAGYDVGDEWIDISTVLPIWGRVRIADQWIWIAHSTEVLEHGRGVRLLKFDELVQGHAVGLYLEVFESGPSIVAVASYAVLDPEPMPGQDAAALAADFNRSEVFMMLLFGLVAAGIGIGVGCVDGVICRQPRRAVLGGAIGAVVGFVGGYLASLIAGLVYAPLNDLAMHRYDAMTRSLSTTGFLIQTGGRGIAWLAAGMAMGLGPGIALRSTRLLGYGFLGGMIGGLLGGLLFDPIDFLVVGSHTPGAQWSRMLGIVIIGAGVGSMIGVVELLARDAWLGMLKGPLVGKEFLLFRDVMRLGASPQSDIYLFNDDQVAADHAVIRVVGARYEIAAISPRHPVLVNERATGHARLRHGDGIGLGRTRFVFHRRKAG